MLNCFDVCKVLLAALLFLACSAATARAYTIAFEHGNLISMESDAVHVDQRVIVRDGEIAAIEPSAMAPSLPVDETIDATGRYLVPGFIDTHFHWRNDVRSELSLAVANGITTVLNMGVLRCQDHAGLRRAIAAGEILAPRYFTTGPMLKRHDVKTSADAAPLVGEHKALRYDFVKIHDNLPRDGYEALIAEAARQGMAVIGHGQHHLPLQASLRMKSISHAEEFMYIFSAAQRRDLAFLAQAAKQIKASGMYVAPTLGTFDMIRRHADPQLFAALAAEDQLKYLPRGHVEYWQSDRVRFRSNPHFSAPESLERLQRELQWQMEFTRLLHETGVPLLAGSDNDGLHVPGFALHRELELLNQAGLAQLDVLKAATINPARFLGIADTTGSIATGKAADLVLLEANPLADIRNTRRVGGVMLAGRWLDRQQLDEVLAGVERTDQRSCASGTDAILCATSCLLGASF